MDDSVSYLGYKTIYGCLYRNAFTQVRTVKVCMCACAHPYLKVGELRVVEVRVDVQCGAHHQQRFKLVQGGADVAGEAQTPDFQKSLQVK